MSAAIVPVGTHQVTITSDSRRALEPRNFDEAFKLARITAASGMFGVKTAEEACVRIMTGVSLGLTAMQSLRGIHVVKGRPVLSADLMAAIALASGQCEYFDCEHTSADRAVYVTKRAGRPERRLEWTMAMAKEVRVDGVPLTNKDVWKSYPGPMLRARCIAALARMVYPDLLLGVYTPEELAEQPAGAPVPDEVAVEIVAYAQSEGPATSQLTETIGRVDPIGDAVAELRQVCKAGGVHEMTFKRLAKSLKHSQVEPAEAMRQAHEAAALVVYKAKVEGAANAGQLDDIMAEAIGDERLSEWARGEVRDWCGLGPREPGEDLAMPTDEQLLAAYHEATFDPDELHHPRLSQLRAVAKLASEVSEAEANYIDVKRQRAERETFGTYQAFVQETAVWHARPDHIGEAAVPLVWALGACEEAGEVAKEVKRHVVYGRPLDRDALLGELGDALWYLTAAASSLGLMMTDVAKANEAKVRAKFGHRDGVDRDVEP